MFFGRFGTFPRPFDLSTEGVALSHQGACIREVRNFCHWASCRDPNLLNWDLGRTSPWTPMESTDPLNSGGCDSSRLGSPNGRSCKLPASNLQESPQGPCKLCQGVCGRRVGLTLEHPCYFKLGCLDYVLILGEKFHCLQCEHFLIFLVPVFFGGQTC